MPFLCQFSSRIQSRTVSVGRCVRNVMIWLPLARLPEAVRVSVEARTTPMGRELSTYLRSETKDPEKGNSATTDAPRVWVLNMIITLPPCFICHENAPFTAGYWSYCYPRCAEILRKYSTLGMKLQGFGIHGEILP
jgi:hypothetical protein